MSLNEEKILSGNFVFISYSHKDQAAVTEDMEALLGQGVRVWFDVNMRLGDNWAQIAEQTILHKNCVGAVFYVSANALVSDACQKEQELVSSRVKEGNFQYWQINLEGKLTPNIFAESLPLAMSQGKTSYMKPMKRQMDMFDDSILCVLRTDSQTTVNRIFNEIAVPQHLVDNEDNFMDDAKKAMMSSTDSGCISLGRYIDCEYYGPEQATDMEDQRFGSALNLIQLNGKRYTTKPLYWKLLYVQDGKAVLLCRNILTQTTFFNGEAFLKDRFIRIAFSSEELAKLNPISARYMRTDDIDKCVNAHTESALTLSEDGRLIHWWINENGLTVNWKQTFSNDYHYKKGFSIFVKKGLRPIIELPAQKIK